MPPLVLLSSGPILDIDATLFVYLGVFLLLFLILRALVFRPMMALFDERERAIDGGDREREARLARAADSASNAALLARQRFSSGLVDFQTVLDTQRTQLSAQDNLASAGADISADHVRLFKALGGFATNGVDLMRLESHLRDGAFTAAEFLIDIDGTPEDPAVARALEELAFHSRWVRILGSYPRVPLDPDP